MKTLRKSDRDLIGKVNEFRDAAKTVTSHAHATNVMRELTWLLSIDDRKQLEEAWRNTYVDASTVELDTLCDKIVSRIQGK